MKNDRIEPATIRKFLAVAAVALALTAEAKEPVVDAGGTVTDCCAGSQGEAAPEVPRR